LVRLSDFNPLEHFKELTIFPRTVFLLGFIVLFVGIAQGAGFYNKTAIAGISLVAFGISCHYFSTCRWQEAGEPDEMHFDKLILLRAFAMLIVAGGIAAWACYIPTVPPKNTSPSESAAKETKPAQPEQPPSRPVSKPTRSTGANGNKPVEGSNSFDPIQVKLNCGYTDLPIAIPAGKVAHVLFLDRARNAIRKSGGFFSISNTGQRFPLLWPDSLMRPGSYKAIQCDVKNHGKQNLTELQIPIQTNYENSQDITYTAFVGSLDSGEPFSFYIVNPCSLQTWTHIPVSGSAHAVGEPVPRPITFERDDPNSVTVGLPKGEMKWMGGNSCD
jgi:hypothetical protein